MPVQRTGLLRLPSGEPRVLPPSELPRFGPGTAPDGGLAWLDVQDPTPGDIEQLGRQLNLHPLAIEDLRKRRQRPKIDTYPDHYLLVAYEVRAANDGKLTRHELHLIAGERFLVTIHWTHCEVIAEAQRRFRQRTDVTGTVGALLYAVLDGVADGYFPVLDVFSDRVSDLEDQIVGGEQSATILRDMLNLKRGLLELRRVVAPLRDATNSLLRRDLSIVDEASVPYYQDLYDHLVRVLDSIDLYRELMAAALDANLAMTSNTLNLVVRRLTALTVILMVPTLIAGIYGMNLAGLPGFQWPAGWAVVLALMVVTVVGLTAFFRARNWF